MKVYLAADHAGFELKNFLAEQLSAEYEVEDLGANVLDPDDDYPAYAKQLADKIVSDHGSRGIMVCGSGQGMAIVANRNKGVRAAIVWNEETAKETREDNDSNVLSLPARFIDQRTALAAANTWLKTPFAGTARHQRRVNQIDGA